MQSRTTRRKKDDSGVVQPLPTAATGNTKSRAKSGELNGHAREDMREDTLGGFVYHRLSEVFSTELDLTDCKGLYRHVIGEVEGALLRSVMEKVGGHQGRAASILGLTRDTLRKKLRAHRLL